MAQIPSQQGEPDVLEDVLQYHHFLRVVGVAANRRVLAVAAVLYCTALIGSCRAADAHYSEVVPDQAMKEWIILGPIPAQEGDATANVDNAHKMGFEQDLLESAGGEAKANPEKGQSLNGRGGQYEWRLTESERDVVDLSKTLGPHDFAVAYAAAAIESPEDQSRLVGLGSDDAVRVWFNGELVHENDAARPVAIDDDVFSIKLKKGTNRLLVKVVNNQQDWGFTFRFLSPATASKRLIKSAMSGDDETVKKLVAAGVDANAKLPAGITAAQIAKMRGHDQVVDFLIAEGATPPQPFDVSEVVPAILSEIASDDAPGVAVLVARDGKVLLSRGFGIADLANNVPVNPNTKFRIGSITKQFTASAILKLQEEGRLKVNDKLSKYFPDYPRGDEVTLHHLLTHTSGIKSFTSKPDFLTTVTVPSTTEQMINSFKGDPFDFDPGTKFSYDNSGYFLLGAIVEKVSGKSYGDYLRETFFDPLGMHDTGVHSATAVIKNEATGYSYLGGSVSRALNWDMSRAGGAGILYSTVEDLMRWNEGIFGGKVLSDESLRAAFTPVTLTTGDEPSMSYGYGWEIGERRGLKTISHGGGLNGWSAQLIRYVDQRVTVVALHNALPPVPGLSPGEASELAADAFLWQEMKPIPRMEVDDSVDAATFAAYVGRYDAMGAVVEVALDGKQLTAHVAGQSAAPLSPLGGGRFFLKAANAQIEFVQGDDGHAKSARIIQGGQKIAATRMVDEKAVNVDEETLDRYVGKYEYENIGVLTVRRDGQKLLAQMTGQPEFEIYPKSSDEFYWKVVAAEIKFVAGKDGKVEKAIHQQAGAKLEAKKIE